MTNTESRLHTTHQTLAAATLLASTVNPVRMTCGELEEIEEMIAELEEDFNFWIVQGSRSLALSVANLQDRLREVLAA
jgi:hypothetical protein